MAIKYVVYAQPDDHDAVIKRIRKEVQKDRHWTDKRLLEPGESQELKAVISAVNALGLHLFRTESKFDTYTVVIGA